MGLYNPKESKIGFGEGKSKICERKLGRVDTSIEGSCTYSLKLRGRVQKHYTESRGIIYGRRRRSYIHLALSSLTQIQTNNVTGVGDFVMNRVSSVGYLCITVYVFTVPGTILPLSTEEVSVGKRTVPSPRLFLRPTIYSTGPKRVRPGIVYRVWVSVLLSTLRFVLNVGPRSSET